MWTPKCLRFIYCIYTRVYIYVYIYTRDLKMIEVEMCDLTTLRSASATSAAGAKAIQLISTAFGHSPWVDSSPVGYRCLLKNVMAASQPKHAWEHPRTHVHRSAKLPLARWMRVDCGSAARRFPSCSQVQRSVVLSRSVVLGLRDSWKKLSGPRHATVHWFAGGSGARNARMRKYNGTCPAVGACSSSHVDPVLLDIFLVLQT